MNRILCLIWCLFQVIFASTYLKSVNNLGMFYYDAKSGEPLCGEMIPHERIPAERIIFRGLPCSCNDLSCSCCAGINLSSFNFNQTACTKFTYHPLDFAVSTQVFMNENVILDMTFSAKNPRPICVPVPYLPTVKFCARFFNIFTPGRNLHACMDFETRVANAPVLILHFDCVRLGTDGIAWLKPEANGGLTMTTTQSQPDLVYDEVDFEPQENVSSLCGNATYNIQNDDDDDDMIGQLKD